MAKGIDNVYSFNNAVAKFISVVTSMEHNDTVIGFHSSRMALSSVPTLKGIGLYQERAYVAQKCICCCA